VTTRALIGVGGTALASLPERDGERLWVASVRTGGRLLRAGVAYVGRANEKVESADVTPPAGPLVSGSANSLLPFSDFGQQGRRFRHRRGHPGAGALRARRLRPS
jgi:hypothetical protein